MNRQHQRTVVPSLRLQKNGGDRCVELHPHAGYPFELPEGVRHEIQVKPDLYLAAALQPDTGLTPAFVCPGQQPAAAEADVWQLFGRQKIFQVGQLRQKFIRAENDLLAELLGDGAVQVEKHDIRRIRPVCQRLSDAPAERAGL